LGRNLVFGTIESSSVADGRHHLKGGGAERVVEAKDMKDVSMRT
jgi:hypothetical protein